MLGKVLPVAFVFSVWNTLKQTKRNSLSININKTKSTFTILWVKSADYILKYFSYFSQNIRFNISNCLLRRQFAFSYFSQKIGFDISCKLSPCGSNIYHVLWVFPYLWITLDANVLCDPMMSCVILWCLLWPYYVWCDPMSDVILWYLVWSYGVLCDTMMSCVILWCLVWSCDVLCDPMMSCVILWCLVYPTIWEHPLDLM